MFRAASGGSGTSADRSGTRAPGSPQGARVREALGLAWTGRGRPRAGYFTTRTAGDWFVEFLDEARRDAAAGSVSTGVTFAEAAEEYLRFAEQDAGCQASTHRRYLVFAGEAGFRSTATP
ncbi:MAG: hypothetical protein ACJ780_26945 [Solirubrobacteraceae bacterium]